MNTQFQTTIQKISNTILSWFKNSIFQYVMLFLYSPIGWWSIWKYGKQAIWLKILFTIISLPFAFINIFSLSWIGIPILLFLYFTQRSVQKNIKIIAGVLSILPIVFSAAVFAALPSSSSSPKETQVADLSSISSVTVSSKEELSSIPVSSSLPESVAPVEPSQTPSEEPVVVPSAEPVIEAPSSQIPPSSVAPPPTPSVAPTPPPVSSTAPVPSVAPAPASSAVATPQPRVAETPAVETPAPTNGGGNGNNFNTYSDTQVTAAYVGNKNSKIFHKDGCQSIKSMKPSNIVDFSTRDEVISAGYTPCQKCNP